MGMWIGLTINRKSLLVVTLIQDLRLVDHADLNNALEGMRLDQEVSLVIYLHN